ncbi:MAG: hypothetical protein JXM68_12095 [Sedimentisphaerales bacterium]|nr:hypothetical protein [Sedimentisphaerales bacterium]
MSIYGAGETSIITTSAALNPIIELSSTTQGTDGNQSISYLMFDGNSLTGTRAILVVYRDSVIIHDITVKDFSAKGVDFDGVSSGEPTTYSTGNKIYNCTFQNTTARSGAIVACGQSGMEIYNNTLEGYQRALGHDVTLIGMVGGYNKGLLFHDNDLYMSPIYFDSDGTTALWGFHFESWDVMGGHQIYDNTFTGGHVAIDVGGTFNVKGSYDYSWDIYNNTFQQLTNYASEVTGTFAAIIYEGGVQDLIIRENRFKNWMWGIQSSILQSPRSHERIYVYNNLFDNMGWGDDAWDFAIYLGQGVADAVTEDIYIYNNTVNSVSTGLSGIVLLNSTYTVDRIYIKNNILTKSVSYGAVCFWDGAGTIDSVFVEHNCWYGNNDTTYYRNGKTISNSVFSDNITGSPLFKSNETYRLRPTSPCIDAGIDVDLTTDYWGHRIPQGTAPDIGACEYGNYVLFYNGKQLY